MSTNINNPSDKRTYPSRWTIMPAKVLFAELDSKSQTGTEALLSVSHKTGIKPRSSSVTMFMSESLIGYKKCEIGDIAANTMWTWQGAIGVSMYSGVVSPAYNVYRLKADYYNLRFLDTLLRERKLVDVYHSLSSGIRPSRLRLYPDQFLTIKLPVPPRAEQDQIVRYLDWQVSKINRLITAKKKQILLLNAQEHAVVDDYVTHGLVRNVSMQTSGVNWLGAIPKHWTICKLRTLLKPFSEKNRPDLPLLSVVREKGVIVCNVEDTESNHNFIPDDLSGYKVVHGKQFVINQMKAWQGSYGIAPCDGIVSPAYFVFDISFDNLKYFHYAIRSKVYVNFFAQASDGIRVGQWDLSIDKMKNIPFIVPPADEQKEIVRRIIKDIAGIQRAVIVTEKQIAILEEMRTRLISDVVTGQMDVRGIDIPDFEYTPDTDSAEDTDDAEDEESSEDAT